MCRCQRALCKAVHQRRQQPRPERGCPASPTPRGEGSPTRGAGPLPSCPAPGQASCGPCFPIPAGNGRPLAFCLPAPAAPAAQQDPAPAAPEDHAQADVRGLRDRAVSEPSPSLSPLSGVYLIGPVMSDTRGSCSSSKGVCSQPWDAQPFGVGSEVDSGLGVLGVCPHRGLPMGLPESPSLASKPFLSVPNAT